MRKKFFTVMLVKANQIGLLIRKGSRAVVNLTANIAKFPDVTNSGAVLQPEVELLEQLAGKADGGSELDTANMHIQAEKVYNMMLENCPDIDKVAKGDKATILLSGYDASAEPQSKTTPGIPSIKEIVDGPTPGSAKVKLDSFEVGAMHIVEFRLVGELPWRQGVQTTNSHALIIDALEKAKEIEVRVADQNSKGKGKYTPPMAFLPR
jgi:hypothetical protein